jgi:hypothetical protein
MGRNWGMRSECGEAGQVWVVRGLESLRAGRRSMEVGLDGESERVPCHLRRLCVAVWECSGPRVGVQERAEGSCRERVGERSGSVGAG